MPHILIIGAGLVGACLAFRLSRAGAEVTLVEAAHPASGASGASFGWINASFFHSAAHFALRAQGIAAHHRLEAALGEGLALWQGCLWWEEEGPAQDRVARGLADMGYPVQVLDRRQILAREPALSAPEQALFFPSEGACDAAVLTHRLIRASGARVIQGQPVSAILDRAGRAGGVRLGGQSLWADHVILAAGTGSPALLQPLGLALPMLPRPGMILRTRPVAARLAHILASPGQELRQDRDLSLLAPLSAGHQGDAATSLPADPAPLARAALARIAALLPGLDPDLASLRPGWRPVPADGLPALGQTALAGLTLAVLHSGVTLAPLVSELLTLEILHDQPQDLLAPFRPQRFGS